MSGHVKKLQWSKRRVQTIATNSLTVSCAAKRCYSTPQTSESIPLAHPRVKVFNGLFSLADRLAIESGVFVKTEFITFGSSDVSHVKSCRGVL